MLYIGLTAPGQKMYIGHAALGTKIYPGLHAPGAQGHAEYDLRRRDMRDIFIWTINQFGQHK